MPHGVWIRELRAPFLLLPVIFVPTALGIAWTHGFFNPILALLTLAGVVCLHASVNVLNDYFDFRSGIDLATTPTPFSGGSTILPSKLLSPTSVLYAGILFLGLGLAAGAYLIYQFAFDPLLIAITAFAAVSILAYSSVLSKWGVGELVVGLNFGPLLFLGTYYVQARAISAEPLIVGTALGILTAGILYINEFPDAAADGGKGRRHLVVRWGKAKAASRFKFLVASAYAVVVLGVIAGKASPFALISLLALPKARAAPRILVQNYDKTMELIPGMASMVITTLLTGVLLFVSYLALGLIR